MIFCLIYLNLCRKIQYPLFGFQNIGLVLLQAKTDESVYFITYTPLNFRSANMIKSHHESYGTFFYQNPNKNLRTYIMLNEEKTQSIDTSRMELL